MITYMYGILKDDIEDSPKREYLFLVYFKIVCTTLSYDGMKILITDYYNW